MDENWYTNESVWSLSFFYPDPQEDQRKKKQKKKLVTRITTKSVVTEGSLQSSCGVEEMLITRTLDSNIG